MILSDLKTPHNPKSLIHFFIVLLAALLVGVLLRSQFWHPTMAPDEPHGYRAVAYFVNWLVY